MAVGIREEALDGFRGGVAARRAPLDFGDEQWAKLHGFVVEDGAVLRSQWPLQQIEGLEDIASFGVYRGFSETPFLVAVQNDGKVVWREAPPDDVEHGSSELSESWHPLYDEDGTDAANEVTVDSSVRPVVEVPMDAAHLSHASGGLRPALMLNSIHISDGADVWWVYEADSPSDESETLRAMTLGSSNKWPEDDETEASPKAQHGLIWNGVLVLGDIEWKADPESALSSSNKTRFSNGLWLGVAGEPLLFDPLSVLFIDNPSARITGLSSTNHGLLIFVNSQEGIGGVYMLRGTPDAFTLEDLHVGLGVTEGNTHWMDTSTDVWINSSGEVWQTDTDSVRRVDRQGLGTDRQNPDEDGVKAFGPWLVAVRERRMFALRALDDGRTAAWTELSIEGLPGLPDLRKAQEVGESLYFKAGNALVRFTRSDLRTGQSERGHTPTGWADLAVGTRTLATGQGHNKTFWHRVGVRATGGFRATKAEVAKVILRAGPVLDVLAPSLERVGPWELVTEGSDQEGTFEEASATWDVSGTPTEMTWGGLPIKWVTGILPVPTHSPKRWQAIVRGIGASNECSAEVVFNGDVQVEQVSVFYKGSILGGDEEGR